MPPFTPKKLYAASALRRALWRLGSVPGRSRRSLRRHRRSDIKLSWSLPAAAACSVGDPGHPVACSRLALALLGRHISVGRAQPTPLRLRLRSQPARWWRAFLSPAPARLRCSRPPWRSSLCCSRPSQSTLLSPSGQSAARRPGAPVLTPTAPRLGARGRPVARRLARALERRVAKGSCLTLYLDNKESTGWNLIHGAQASAGVSKHVGLLQRNSGPGKKWLEALQKVNGET